MQFGEIQNKVTYGVGCVFDPVGNGLSVLAFFCGRDSVVPDGLLLPANILIQFPENTWIQILINNNKRLFTELNLITKHFNKNLTH